MYAELRDDGVLIYHKRRGRLMKPDGLVGFTRRRKWRTTTQIEMGARCLTWYSVASSRQLVPSSGR
jgi:hypothetical protein